MKVNDTVDHGVWLHLVAPSAALALTAMGVLLERGLTEELQQRRVRELLQRYVSPQVARHLLADPHAYDLGGKRVMVTVLFSDIRGFTPMSEAMKPEAVVAILNEYFERMVAIIMEQEGTLMQYAGDEIMAVWGAPIARPDHAHRAVQAGVEMLAALRALHAIWRERGQPAFDIGIGINSGEAVAGNIGSSKREQYAVVGDTVNTASRVEALNKELGTSMIITASTYHLVQDTVEVRPLPPTLVKGKADPLTVFEVLGQKEVSSPYL